MENYEMKIAAKGADKAVMLKWSDIPEADGYRVYMAENGEYNGVRNIKENSVKLNGLENGRLYSFMVKAMKTSENGGNEYVCETEKISCAALGSPVNLTAESEDEAVSLSWDGVEGADFYRIYAAEGEYDKNGEKAKFSALNYSSAENCVIHGLNNAIEYKFKVRAGVFIEEREYYGGFSNIESAQPAQDKLRLSPPYLYLEAGQQSGFVCGARNVSWRSSNPEIAEVDGLGTIKAVSNGSALIAVTADNGRENFADVFVGRDKSKIRPALPMPRYTGRNNILFPRYTEAKILISGDIMCLAEQQDFAETKNNGDYSYVFDYMKELISAHDYAVSTIIYEYSRKKSCALRQPWLDGARNYNASARFPEAVREAGYDCVISAAPVTGETSSEFIRSGINYTDVTQKGRIVAEINGILTAFIGFRFDGNLTYDTINPADVAAAKNEGADFIVAVCRWGVRNSRMVRPEQRLCAERLASFGADCIIGGGAGVIQSSEIVKADDGREVPVFYALGNCATSLNDLPDNRDGAALSLTIQKPYAKSSTRGASGTIISEMKLIPHTMNEFNFACVPAVQGSSAYSRIAKAINEDLLSVQAPVQASEAPPTYETAKLPEIDEITSDIHAETLPITEATKGFQKELRFVGIIGSEALTNVFEGIEYPFVGENPLLISEINDYPNQFDLILIDFYNAAVNIPNVKDVSWISAMDSFIEAVKKTYASASDKVCVVTHRLNKFYACEKQVRLSGEAPGGENVPKLSRIIKKLEDYFIEKACSRAIDIAKDYFVTSQSFPETSPKYDMFFSEHLKRIVSAELDALNNDETTVKTIETGDIWLKRYLYYYDNLNFRKLAPFALSSNCAASVIAENASKEFILENYADLIELKNENLSLEELTANAKFPELKTALSVIAALLENNFDADLKYSLIFDYNFEIRTKLIQPVSKGLKELFPEFDKTVTLKTLPFYFKLLRYARKAVSEGESISGAREALNELASSSEKEVDVWGTDVSYLSAKLCESEKIAIRNYIEKNPFCWAFSEPINVAPNAFDSLSAFTGSEERRNLTRNAFERRAPEIISSSRAKWLIIDFYDLAEEMNVYKNGVFEIDEFTRRTVFFNNIKKECKTFRIYKNYDKNAVFEALDKTINIVKAKYGDNIILNRANLAEYFIATNGDVLEIPADKEFIDKTSVIIAECENYFIEKTGCYSIDVSGYFMSSESYPNGGADVCNYEDAFYKNNSAIIADIVNGKSENKTYGKINSVYKIMKLME